MLINNIKDFVNIARKNGICKYEKEILQDDYVWLQNEVDNLIKENISYSIFTVLDGQGREIYIVNGFWRINRLGYVVIKIPDVKIPDEGLIY